MPEVYRSETKTVEVPVFVEYPGSITKQELCAIKIRAQRMTPGQVLRIKEGRIEVTLFHTSGKVAVWNTGNKD